MTGRGCLLGNPGAACGGPRRPARASSRALRLSGTSRSRGLPLGTRVRRFWARPALRDPPLPRRSTRTGSTWDALFAGRDRRNARHCCGTRDGGRAPRPPGPPPPTGFNPGADRCHVRCWIQTPRQGRRHTHHATAPDSGDKSDRGKCAPSAEIAPNLRSPRERLERSLRCYAPSCRRVAGIRLAITLSMRRPSRSTTSNRQPETSTDSPAAGRRRKCASTKPATVW